MHLSSILKIFVIFVFISTFNINAADFSFNDVPIRIILSKIASSGNLNIILNRSIKGKSTIHLNDISSEDALYIFCRANSLTLEKDGNIFIIGNNPSIYSSFLYKLSGIESFDIKRLLKTSFPKAEISIIDKYRVWIRIPRSIDKQDIINFIKRIDTPLKNITFTLSFSEESETVSSNYINKGKMNALVMQNSDACFHVGKELLLPWWGIIYRKGYYLNIRAGAIMGNKVDIEFNWNLSGGIDNSSGINRISLINGRKLLIGALVSEEKGSSYSIELKTKPSIMFSSSRKKRRILVFAKATWNEE